MKALKLTTIGGLVAFMVLTGIGWQTLATTSGPAQPFDVHGR